MVCKAQSLFKQGWPENENHKTVCSIQDFRKQDSWRTITRRLSNAGFVCGQCLKSHFCLRKTSRTDWHVWQNKGSLTQSASAELDFSCLVMVQRGVFEDLVKYNSERISATIKHGRSVMVWGAFSAVCTGELLHCEKSINALNYGENTERLASHTVVF